MQDIFDGADVITLNTLSQKSKEKYDAVFTKFIQWRNKEKQIPRDKMCKEVLLVYLNELSKENNLAPPTVCSRFFMLETTLLTYENINIKLWPKPIAYLKSIAKGYRPRKANIFTATDITNFCAHAPDNIYLLEKVIL